MIHFYAMADAVAWAESQSQYVSVESANVRTLCTVINTDTGTKRWWFNGTEYTG